jgi:glutamate-ammonia-ligase adenylyltransferase
MTAGSDLDLLLLYDFDPAYPESDGDRPLHATQYFARMTQRLVSALTTPTNAGKLYDVDLRLRPSGRSGPVATSLASFHIYQREEAWTWEHMALTRARVICGPPELASRIAAAIREVLSLVRDPEKLRADVADMRARMARERKGDDVWEVKHYRGGLVDVEFITQYLQLRHAHAHPEVLATNTADALGRIARAGLIDADVAAELIAATRLWRNVQGLLRLNLAATFDDATAPTGLRNLLVEVVDTEDFHDLKTKMEQAAAAVRSHFAALVGEPASAAVHGA